MSQQESSSDKGKLPAHDQTADETSDVPSTANDLAPTSNPDYMTVGTGATSEHVARLQAMLENDSGYGGSSTGDDLWHPALHADTHIPLSYDGSEAHRRAQAGAVHQLWYNQHRGTLGRSIGCVLDLLRELQEMNATWPAHYPSVQKADPARSTSRPASRQGFSSPGMSAGNRSYSSAELPQSPPPMLRRAMTSVEDHAAAESSKAAEARATPEPRLVTPQIAQEFSILKLDLKLGALHQAELVHSLEKGSIASLLDGKISSSIKHLLALRERIEDTSSKVLVTGDLNAGKSTFCNALLRRKVLPEDQQPCTAIFCEVLDARENANVEEVHAVHKDRTYDRNDESTYDVYSLEGLEQIVGDNDKYIQCKVYVRDSRTIDESLLNNGVVDIALIDAPGLNSDTTKTTAVFARQEEIDVVVFVVSAANHFTITAQEFIWAAAAEKAYLFIVVNGFDAIKNKEKCQNMILQQVKGLSPQTFKESSELVHFVSSNSIPTAPPPGGPPGGGGGSGSASGGGGGDDSGDDPKGKGKETEKLRDFQTLEQNLRRFVLEKRAKSKLAPARTYLLNILNDLNTLATVNSEVAQAEINRVNQELRAIEPQLESGKKAVQETADNVEKTIDDMTSEVYNYTRRTLVEAISLARDHTQNVPYPGLFGAFDYAEDVKAAMLSHIGHSVQVCEEYARSKSVSGVDVIKQLGILHVGDEFQNLNFRAEVMFSRKRDALARQVHVTTEFWDFVDLATVIQQQEKVAGTGMALTVATALGSRALGMNSWVDHAMSAARVVSHDNLRRLIIPGVVVAAIAAAAYVLHQIPSSLPRRLQEKISAQLAEMDYVHANSTRVSSSVRKVLRFPADNLRLTLDRSVKELGARREETLKVRGESEVALKYFGNLVRKSAAQRDSVMGIDLETPPPGAAEFH
ncbi:related to GTP-binding protein FZO1, required for biogenesis of mitochondria [Cephalotrichum gorgonifer]|uniref:Related to GTP-binding protein FZO1, required for biogenesis of mitochondria n=1 Tax=Cephalotrichum gorgonifer TaxID=2041049 RepID=A0AAE8SWI7_9PEZI|nr:related to GTP-binding protein FZO1, required for biogenesis of mitochondria [Cephalotrichum gorgonifer]